MGKPGIRTREHSPDCVSIIGWNASRPVWLGIRSAGARLPITMSGPEGVEVQRCKMPAFYCIMFS